MFVVDEGAAVVQLDCQHQGVGIDFPGAGLLQCDLEQRVSPCHFARRAGRGARRQVQGIEHGWLVPFPESQHQVVGVGGKRFLAAHLDPVLAVFPDPVQLCRTDPGRVGFLEFPVGRRGRDLDMQLLRVDSGFRHQAKRQQGGAVRLEMDFRLAQFQRLGRSGQGGRQEQKPRVHCPNRSSHCSAIWMLLVAAPLRRLSLTTQRSSPRGWDKSWRMRPTNTSSRPAASDAAVG